MEVSITTVRSGKSWNKLPHSMDLVMSHEFCLIGILVKVFYLYYLTVIFIDLAYLYPCLKQYYNIGTEVSHRFFYITK